VPAIVAAAEPGRWQVRVGELHFELDGGVVAALDPTRALRVYTAAIGGGTPALLSAELAG
jgi:hypothetical protein